MRFRASLVICRFNQLALFGRPISLYTGSSRCRVTAIWSVAAQCRHLYPAGNPTNGSTSSWLTQRCGNDASLSMKCHCAEMLAAHASAKPDTPGLQIGGEHIVTPEILIVRENNGFRLLHGQLHLTSALCLAPSVKVEVSGEGEALAYWDRRAILVEKDGQKLPLYRA
ncbi:MAG: hypothetical protein JWR21_2518 [Herminiimonas sp.]|nr:hypothetical protein [Herminiimonas sp.]MDB5852424.1 hypothetical protein [Herminiimonas sp.]